MPGLFIGQRFLMAGADRDVQKDDFRAVPKSDRGNAGYDDRGGFGGYAATDKPWSDTEPAIERFAGYGADEGDLRRGYIEPTIREDPAYDLANYRDRSTMPKLPDEDQSNTQTMRGDWEFRSRNERSRGFLTRPRLPTER